METSGVWKFNYNDISFFSFVATHHLSLVALAFYFNFLVVMSLSGPVNIYE
jgi:hypothetical protein